MRQGEQTFYLRKHVKPSAWSHKVGIANVPIQSVPLVNVATDSWNEVYLRHITEGLQIHAILVDSSVEAVRIKSLRKLIWNCDIDIQELLSQIWETKKNEDAATAIPNKTNQLYQYVHPLAKQLTETVVQINNELNKSEADKIEALQARIKELEKETADAKSKSDDKSKSANSGQSSDKSSPQKRPPELPAISPNAKRQKTQANDTFQPNPLVNKRPLEKSAPKSGAKADVDRWINQLKKSLDPAEADKLTAYIESVEKAFADLKPNTPNLKCLAAQWGLPVDTIAKANFGPTALLRVSACAAYTSSILSA